MQQQFLYPIADKLDRTTNAAWNDTFNVPEPSSLLSKVPSSTSGYYTYIDEGVSTANDSDYLYSVGEFETFSVSNIPTNLFMSFQLTDLEIIPSSINLHLRGKYTPVSHSGMIDVVAYIFNSGSFYHYQKYNQDVESITTGLNYDNILASSIFPLTSGVNFTNHNIQMMLNQQGINKLDTYSNSCNLAIGFNYYDTDASITDSFQNISISAIEVIVSGELYKRAPLPLQIPGGDIRLQRDVLKLYHNYDDLFIQELDGLYPFNGVTDSYGNRSIHSCLSSGNFHASGVYRDCFFDFNVRPSGNSSFAAIPSNNSPYVFRYGTILPSVFGGASGLMYVGQSLLDANSDYAASDSFVSIGQGASGIIEEVLPTGDFSLWVGINNLFPVSNNSAFVKGNWSPKALWDIGGANDFVIKKDTDGGYLATIDGYSTSKTADAYRDTQGFIVNVSGSILTLYNLDIYGGLYNAGSVTLGSRTRPYGALSGGLLFGYYPDTVNELSILHEVGIMHSGLPLTDIMKFDRRDLFQQIHPNIDKTTPVVSGDHYIQYKSYEHRPGESRNQSFKNRQYQTYDTHWTSYSIYNANNYTTLVPYVWDHDFHGIYNRYSGFYSNLTNNILISGNSPNFFQDGSVYFSGWLDASTTNPSGFLNKNLVIRLTRDLSTLDSFREGNQSFYFYSYDGKAALGHTTLQSGLNQYVVELDRQNYNCDVTHIQFISSTSIINGYVFEKPDLNLVAHPNWNNANIHMFFQGYDDPVNSGYQDTVKIYSAAIISDNWATPPTGIFNNLDLYMSGIGPATSGCDLYLHSAFGAGGCDLFIQGCEDVSSGTTLFIEGSCSKILDLFLANYAEEYNTSTTLFTFSDPIPSSINSVNLFINSTTNSGIIGNVDMTIVNSGYSQLIPLFLLTESDDENSDAIPLFLMNNTIIDTALNLFLNNTGSSLFNSQRLYIRGNGLTPGAFVHNSGHTLTIGGGNESWYNSVQLSIAGPTGSESGAPLMIQGGTFVSSALNLVIPSSVGEFTDNLSLYSHGF